MYTLSIEKDGFERFEKSDMLLRAAGRLTIGTSTLKIGPRAEVVIVNSLNPLVETTSFEQSSVLSAEEMASLPVIGNDYVSLTKIVPGSTYLGGSHSASTPPKRVSWVSTKRAPLMSERMESFQV